MAAHHFSEIIAPPIFIGKKYGKIFVKIFYNNLHHGIACKGTATAETKPTDTDADRILIVYFSRYGNMNYPNGVDATTSARILVSQNKRYGTTKCVANLAQQRIGGDIHLIETVTPYTTDFDELRDVNHKEMQQGILPDLKESNLSISDYDTVFIGYPVWAVSVPQAVLSFLDEYDLSGKSVIPFCTHDGYGA